MESNSGELKMKSAGAGFGELLFGTACQHQLRVDFLTPTALKLRGVSWGEVRPVSRTSP